ncbi:hypothetical protein [Halomonas denitrificans]|nr:hypothetical protein [Halomonas denitrificans]
MNPRPSSSSLLLPALLAAVLAAMVVLAGCATSSAPGLPTGPDCSDQARFDLALAGEPVPPACAVAAPDEAYGLGAMIRENRETIRRARMQLRNLPPDSERAALRLRQQLIRAERDLPELEALARLEGWLPPAELPDAPPD